MLDRARPRKVIQRLGFDATAHGCRSSFADWSRKVDKADREVRRTLMQQWADYVTGTRARRQLLASQPAHKATRH